MPSTTLKYFNLQKIKDPTAWDPDPFWIFIFAFLAEEYKENHI